MLIPFYCRIWKGLLSPKIVKPKLRACWKTLLFKAFPAIGFIYYTLFPFIP